jgi:hypothetical protein
VHRQFHPGGKLLARLQLAQPVGQRLSHLVRVADVADGFHTEVRLGLRRIHHQVRQGRGQSQ